MYRSDWVSLAVCAAVLGLGTVASAQSPPTGDAMGPPPAGMGPPPGSGPIDYVALLDDGDGHPHRVAAAQGSVQGTPSASDGHKLMLKSAADHTNGLYVHGQGTHFTLVDSRIELSGMGSSDFDGVSAGVLVRDGAELTLRNVHITTDGAVSTAATSMAHGTLRVYNSAFDVHGGPLPSGYVRKIGPGMMEPPTPLGISGTARATLTMGDSQSYYYDSRITSEGWGAMSTDMAGKRSYLEVNRCIVKVIRSGYGTYADGGAVVVVNDSNFDTATYTGVIAGSGQMTFNNTTAQSLNNAFMIHSVMAPDPSEKALLQLKGGSFRSRNAAILIKSANADVDITGSELHPTNGDAILAVVNDDPFATKVNGHKIPGTHVALHRTTVLGNILNLDTARPMNISLEHSSVHGAIRNATLKFDTDSHWVATADSNATIVEPVEIGQLDAAKGVTIHLLLPEGATLHGHYTLASGGILVADDTRP